MAGAALAADFEQWAGSVDPVARTRFIPIELWTGADWNGKRDLQMTPADHTFGKRRDKHIRGPVAWTRAGSRDSIPVYERDNAGKKQLFTLSSRGDGLGRVFDSRYGRDCVDEVKFPLGVWREGEVREFDVSCNNGALRRRIRLTIDKLDFAHDGVPHSLQFHWVVDGGRKPGTNMHYIYSPGRGLVSVDED
jgi:hypothetical protein